MQQQQARVGLLGVGSYLGLSWYSTYSCITSNLLLVFSTTLSMALLTSYVISSGEMEFNLSINPKPNLRSPRHGPSAWAVVANNPTILFAALRKSIVTYNLSIISGVAFPNMLTKTVDCTAASVLGIFAKMFQKNRLNKTCSAFILTTYTLISCRIKFRNAEWIGSLILHNFFKDF